MHTVISESTYSVYNLKSNPTTIMYYCKKKQAGPPHIIDCPSLPSDTWIKDILVARPLLTPVVQKLCKCKHSVLTSRSCVRSRSLLSIAVVSCCSWRMQEAYPDKKVQNKTISRLVTTFRDTENVCLRHVLIERQRSWNYGRTDFKQSISCNNGIRL
jgi:hypothetical protein